MEKVTWQDIERLYQEFQKLGISEAVDYETYYLYSLITHSTVIEGSMLTELDILFPTKIFKEDREEYILSLRQSQEEETNQPFLDFMAMQLKKSLALEIERFKASQKKGFSFMF